MIYKLPSDQSLISNVIVRTDLKFTFTVEGQLRIKTCFLLLTTIFSAAKSTHCDSEEPPNLTSQKTGVYNTEESWTSKCRGTLKIFTFIYFLHVHRQKNTSMTKHY